MSVLAVRNLSKNFGGVQALFDVSLSIEAGARHVLIGPNGAGKTTLFHAISGNFMPSSGSVELLGVDITQLAPHKRAKLGLARTFQITNLFPHLTVQENVLLAVAAANDVGPRLFKPLSAYKPLYEAAARLIEERNLVANVHREVRYLSYGEQRQVELALALAGSPKLLLLDEPTAGLAQSESARVVDTIQKLPRDITILMIEHDMDVAFQLADRISLLHQGRLIVEGDQATVRADPRVSEIYLGEE